MITEQDILDVIKQIDEQPIKDKNPNDVALLLITGDGLVELTNKDLDKLSNDETL
jgi:hypothetical protein